MSADQSDKDNFSIEDFFQLTVRCVNVLVKVSTAMIKCHHQSNWRIASTSSYTCNIKCITEGSQSRHSKQELSRNLGRMGLTSLLSSLFSQLSYTVQDHPPKGDTTLSELDPPTTIITREIPYRLANRQSDEAVFLVQVPSSYMCLDLCQVDKNQPPQSSQQLRRKKPHLTKLPRVI